MTNLSFRLIVLLTVCILFFTGCKKDDELSTDELSTKDKLVGKWTYENFKTTEYRSGAVVKSETTVPTEQQTIEFNFNGSYVITYDIGNGVGMSGNTGSWKLSDNAKKVILEGLKTSYENTFVIEELTDKKLRLTSQHVVIEEGITRKLEINLKK